MIELENETIAAGDTTPSFIEQSRLRGWKAGLFNFGKAESEGMEFFNPGLIRRPDGLWLLVRASEPREGMLFGHNKIWACRLSESLVPEGGPVLQFPDSAIEEQFEDPRVVFWNGQAWVGCVNFTWFEDGTWTGAHQVLGIFTAGIVEGGEDKRWTPLARRDPPVETNLDRAGNTNGRHNKNWVWFFHESKLHLIYMSDPWHVVQFGSGWDQQTHFRGDGVKWKYGTVRGGTPPVQGPDGRFYTFFHSSLPWRGRFRRYYMGAIAFEPNAPFAPSLWTTEPLLIGSQNDPWGQRKPLVVFPCGALLEDDFWTISMGINDLKCGWVRIPHEDVMAALQPAPEVPGLALLAAPTQRQTAEHIPFLRDAVASDTTPARMPNATRDDRPDQQEQPRARGNNLYVEDDRIYKPELLGAMPEFKRTDGRSIPITRLPKSQIEEESHPPKQDMDPTPPTPRGPQPPPPTTHSPEEQAVINAALQKFHASRGAPAPKRRPVKKKSPPKVIRTPEQQAAINARMLKMRETKAAKQGTENKTIEV